jgi:hypothetical protein
MIAVVKNYATLIGRDLLRASDFEDIGQSIAIRIARRTARGVDFEGGAFREYSEGYRRRKAKEVGAGPVNLTLSGQMLNDIHVTAATDRSCELGFSTFGKGSRRGTMIQRSRSMGANDKAFYATEGSHGVRRQFFDMSDEDEQFVADIIDRIIDERIGDEGAA